MIRIIQGDCMEVMRTELAPESVQCVVTSPPYYGLRDYGIPATVWGGDDTCEHVWEERIKRGGGAYAEGSKKRWQHDADEFKRDDRFLDGHPAIPAGESCRYCKAWRGALGLEPTAEMYLEHLVLVFRRVHRVLRRDGTLWVNLGDSFTDGGRGDDTGSTLMGSRNNQAETRKVTSRSGKRPFGLGPKQLLMMPARFAIAMQADGWTLRMDIVWRKPNPMPESVRDRCTKAHEFVYHFAKSRYYYYDAPAIAEPVSDSTHRRISQKNLANQHGSDRAHAGGKTNGPMKPVVKMPDGWDSSSGKGRHGSRHRAGREKGQTNPAVEVFDGVGRKAKLGDGNGRPNSRERTGKSNESYAGAIVDLVPMRNARSVWTVRPEPFKGAHFATFPRALVRPCILAGSSARACELCGAPWQPVYGAPVATDGRGSGNKARKDRSDHGGPKGTHRRQAHAVPWKPSTQEVVGYEPTCECGLASGTSRSVVLDPFGGSGTTALVAEQLGRDSIVIEIGAHYVDLARTRTGAHKPAVSTPETLPPDTNCTLPQTA